MICCWWNYFFSLGTTNSPQKKTNALSERYLWSNVPITARVDTSWWRDFPFYFKRSFSLHGHPKQQYDLLIPTTRLLVTSAELQYWVFKANMADARKVFVTVGTTSFDRLIETVSSKAFLEVPKIAIIDYATATFFLLMIARFTLQFTHWTGSSVLKTRDTHYGQKTRLMIR